MIDQKRKSVTIPSKLICKTCIPAESPQPSKTSHFRMPVVQGHMEAFKATLWTSGESFFMLFSNIFLVNSSFSLSNASVPV